MSAQGMVSATLSVARVNALVDSQAMTVPHETALSSAVREGNVFVAYVSA